MTASQTEARRPTLFATILAAGLVIAAAASRVDAAEPALASLLQPLDLRGYRSATIAPGFSAETLGGRELTLTHLRGKVILMNFWASWCVECRPEMRVFEHLHRELGPRGVAIIGVNARESTEVIRRYARELDVTFPLVLDPAGKINTMYGVIGLPTTFLVGRDGRAVAFGVGPRDWGSAAARELIEALLREADSPAR